MSPGRRYSWIVLGAVLIILGLVLGLSRLGPSAQADGDGPVDLPHVGLAARRLAARDARAQDALIFSRAPADSHWLASWTAAPQGASRASALSLDGLDDQSIREVVMTSSSGAAVRIHLSNLYGDRPLTVGRASVAPAGDGGRLAGRAEAISFDGLDSVTIAPGSSVISDPVDLAVRPIERLAVSLYLPRETGRLTYHGSAEQHAFIGGGDQTANSSGDWIAEIADDWVALTGVDTLSPRRYLGSVIALGDSITAGVHSTVGSFGAWPDDLARRLSWRGGETVSVVDEGISGNRVLNASPCCGPSAVSRFGDDVADVAGARDVVLLEGTNDIGFSQDTSPLSAPHTDVSAAQIIAGDRAIIAAAHAAGLKIYGATLLPFKGAFYWTPAAEAKRELVNDWILHSHAFDGVIDFAAVMAEPGHPEVMDPALNSGDHLHPNNAGYAVMARAVDLALFTG